MTGIAQAQIITNFDPGFKNILLNYVTVDTNNDGIAETDYTGYLDTNRDGEIQVSEAQAVKSLVLGYFSGSPFMSYVLQSVAGIENFTNVTYLDCHYNKLTSLDVSGMPQLQTLKCSENKLTSLNVSGLTNLKYLDFSYNNMTAFNATALSNLTTLTCFNNQLTSLVVENLTKLETLDCHSNSLTALSLTGLWGVFKTLDCGFNSITSLDVTPFDLTSLKCQFNQISVLDLSYQRGLTFLQCYNNQLSILDLSNCYSLLELQCSNNQLTSLLMKNGNFPTIGLGFSGNPNLSFICVDEYEKDMVQTLATSYGLTTCAINSYCTFVPGGSYNTIYGGVTFSPDGNCSGSNGFSVNNVRLNLSDGTNTSAIFNYQNLLGGPIFYTHAGDFAVNPALENPSYFTVNAVANVFNFPHDGGDAHTMLFCIAPNGIHSNIETVIVPVVQARPGFNAVYRLVCRNIGNRTEPLVVAAINFDNTKLHFVSSSPSNSNGLNWTFNDLLPFETRFVDITFHVNSPNDSPAVNSGDVLTLTSIITPSGENANQGSFTYSQKVLNSYDPNLVECLEGNSLPTSKIGEYLYYAIHFENTGNSSALNVVLKDVIDETKYDTSSLQIIESSSPIQSRLNNNIAEFIFQSINLQPAGGRGHILLKIKSKKNLVSGDWVAKKANIYFDYNFPIETNDAKTTYGSLGTNDFKVDQSILIFPNPVVNNLSVSADDTIKSIGIFDIQGRLLQTQMGNERNAIVDMSSNIAGVYFVKITTNKGSKTLKFSKK